MNFDTMKFLVGRGSDLVGRWLTPMGAATSHLSLLTSPHFLTPGICLYSNQLADARTEDLATGNRSVLRVSDSVVLVFRFVLALGGGGTLATFLFSGGRPVFVVGFPRHPLADLWAGLSGRHGPAGFMAGPL